MKHFLAPLFIKGFLAVLRTPKGGAGGRAEIRMYWPNCIKPLVMLLIVIGHMVWGR